MFNPQDVFMWLDLQNPMLLQQVHFHVSWLLEQHGVTPGESPDGAEGGMPGLGGMPGMPGAPPGMPGAPPGMPPPMPGAPGGFPGMPDEVAGLTKLPTAPPPGAPVGGDDEAVGEDWFAGGDSGGNGGGGAGNGEPAAKRPNVQYGATGLKQNQMQWTPGGWVMKDNSHKITTSVAQMGGETDIMPAMPSKDYPEVAQDRQKMKMLQQNIQMMAYELHRLCQRFRITKKLDKDTDLTEFPENQRDFLKTAIGCVTNAQKTFDDFRDFIVEEKYAEWAEEQKRLRNATVKAMIGEMPKGVPHKVALQSGGAEEAEAATEEGKEAPQAKMEFDEDGKAKIIFKEDEEEDKEGIFEEENRGGERKEEEAAEEEEEEERPPGFTDGPTPVPAPVPPPMMSADKTLDEIEEERRTGGS